MDFLSLNIERELRISPKILRISRKEQKLKSFDDNCNYKNQSKKPTTRAYYDMGFFAVKSSHEHIPFYNLLNRTTLQKKKTTLPKSKISYLFF